MAKKKVETVREQIFLSYANLAMAHTAVENGQLKYAVLNYMIRAKLLKGLSEGSMSIRSIFDDEKIKLQTGQMCNYCGSFENLALDHIFPKIQGGKDDAENLIFACRNCNSSKGKKDLMEWMYTRGKFLPLMVIRRYLKLTYRYCVDNGLLEKNFMEIAEMHLPFKIHLLPIIFPRPSESMMNSDKTHDK